MSEKITTEDLIEAYGAAGEGLDFKRVYWERRAHARELIAAIEREAAARTLEEAATATESEAPNEPHAGATFTAHADWLRARAAEIREGKIG